jgi:hypothetical protein
MSQTYKPELNGLDPVIQGIVDDKNRLTDIYYDQISSIETFLASPEANTPSLDAYKQARLLRINQLYQLIAAAEKKASDQIDNHLNFGMQQLKDSYETKDKIYQQFRDSISNSISTLIDQSSATYKNMITLLSVVCTGGIAGTFTILYKNSSDDRFSNVDIEMHNLLLRFAVVLAMCFAGWYLTYISVAITFRALTNFSNSISPELNDEDEKRALNFTKKTRFFYSWSLIISLTVIAVLVFWLLLGVFNVYNAMASNPKIEAFISENFA